MNVEKHCLPSYNNSFGFGYNIFLTKITTLKFYEQILNE